MGVTGSRVSRGITDGAVRRWRFALAFAVACALCPPQALHAIDIDKLDPSNKYLFRLIDKPPDDPQAYERIYYKNELIHCTGTNEAATANNRVIALMEQGKFVEAETLLREALKRAPLFFPFEYNLGMCLIHLDRLREALVHLTRAANLVPEFAKTYLQIGYVRQRMAKDELAIEQFRKAIKVNAKEIEGYVLIGDIYFARKQYSMAHKYYDGALKMDIRYPNGLLGLAKIDFMFEKYRRAIIRMQTIDTAREYDKSLHYYYAECLYKMQEYEEAYKQYETLLTFKTDKFFLTNSMALIRHKMELTKRFIER